LTDAVVRAVPGQHADRFFSRSATHESGRDVAFTILTGARDGAIASLKRRHIDLAAGRVDQDARQVNTRFSKSFSTTFFPVGDDIAAVVVDDPLFPATKVGGTGCRKFEAVGLACSTGAAPVESE
jgi:hypothetical protein